MTDTTTQNLEKGLASIKNAAEQGRGDMAAVVAYIEELKNNHRPDFSDLAPPEFPGVVFINLKTPVGTISLTRRADTTYNAARSLSKTLTALQGVWPYSLALARGNQPAAAPQQPQQSAPAGHGEQGGQIVEHVTELYTAWTRTKQDPLIYARTAKLSQHGAAAYPERVGVIPDAFNNLYPNWQKEKISLKGQEIPEYMRVVVWENKNAVEFRSA